MRFPQSRILIFAKAPQPGRVKTRLIPPLTSEQAADLHRDLLSETLERLAHADLAPLELWCAPAPELEPFGKLAARYGLDLHRQAEGDLGARMAGAAQEGLSRGNPVVLLGTDCPALDGDYVGAAMERLSGDLDAVLGPAEDGGYVLLGLKSVAASLFAKMPWGSDRVAALTRERMAALRWKWTELPILWDLDRPADLDRYRE